MTAFPKKIYKSRCSGNEQQEVSIANDITDAVRSNEGPPADTTARRGGESQMPTRTRRGGEPQIPTGRERYAKGSGARNSLLEAGGKRREAAERARARIREA